MRKLFVLVGLSLLVPSTASATWSVIAVDKSTGRVVIASATCVNNNDQFLMDVQAVIVPRPETWLKVAPPSVLRNRPEW